MKNTEIIQTYIKKEHGASLENIAKEIGLSTDFVAGLIDAEEDKYRIIDKTISLNGLGSKLCVVCGESQDYSGHNTLPIMIPDLFLNGKKLDSSLNNGLHTYVKGHRGCYTKIDVFFTENNMLHCIDCSSFHGDIIDIDEVKEYCYRLNYSEVGHKGVIASNPMCNYFSPDNDLKTNPTFEKHKEFWNSIQPEIIQRKEKGYKNLVAILEKAKLLR